jgi:hypothetical protein
MKKNLTRYYQKHYFLITNPTTCGGVMARSSGNFRFSALVLALVACPVALVAQGTTTSALTGVVKDPKGKPLAGATIRISSPSLIGGERVVRTTENGTYRFPMLPPGRYRIVVEAPDHAILTGNELLELGSTATRDWKFPVAAGATVEVVGNTATVESSAVTMTQNYNTEDLAALPTDRSLSGIMSLTPGVNGSRAWGGYSGENAYMMDGMNISDPSGGTVWIFPNIDWFSEIQVAGLGANAEFGGFMGGFTNGLIKRGGNTVEGSVNAYYGDSKWQSNIKTDHPMLTAADKLIQPSSDWDLAFNVGGPLIKDKLWYFVSAERVEEKNSPTGAALPQRNQKIMGLAKVTWAPSANTTLEFLGEYDYIGRDRRGIDYATLPIATVKEEAPDRSFSFTWTQLLGSDKVFTLKSFGYSGRYDLNPYNGEAPPLDTGDIWNGKEYYNNTQVMDKNYRSRATLQATFDLFKTGLLSSDDSHAFRFGLEREQASDEELERYPGGVNLNAGFDEGGVYTDFILTGGGWNIQERVDRLAAFAQDTWRINDRLTLNPGIRFEQFKARYYGMDTLWNKTTWAPRFGFTYALTADQKNVLKGHWGKYYAGFSTYFIDRAIQSAIPQTVYYNWGNYDYIDPFNPASWPSYDINDPVNYEYRRLNDLTVLDGGAKQPYTEETTLSYDHKFDGPWTFSGSYVNRDFKDSLVRKDLAADPDGGWYPYTNPLTGGTFNVWEPGIAGDEHQYVVTNGGKDAKRRYWAGTVALDRKLENNWSLNVSYTHSKLTGNIQRADSYDKVFYNRNTMINAEGLLPGNSDHELKGRMIYQFPWNMRISGTFTYLSGQHWTPTYRTDRLAGVRNIINLEPLGSETYPSRQLLDIRASQFLDLSKTTKMEFFIEVFNALDHQAVVAYTTRANASTDPADGMYSYYKYPDSVDTGRRLRLGLRLSF